MSNLELSSIYSAGKQLGYSDFEQRGIEYLDSGFDSQVYSVGHQILKIYRQHLEKTTRLFTGIRIGEHIKQLEKYMQITNHLADQLSRKPHILNYWWAENLQLVVNPISRMEWSEDLGCMVSLSTLIEGETVLSRHEQVVLGNDSRGKFAYELGNESERLNERGRCKG